MTPAGHVRAALIGYGLAGSMFHGPLLAATPGMVVDAVVTSDPARRDRAQRAFPAAAVLAHVDELWSRASLPDLAVVATATGSHVSVASAAVDAGVAVVVDKPLAPTGDAARVLVARAEQAGVPLTVFHNRRWDADFLTLRRLLGDGSLGAIRRVESRFERWQPQPPHGAWRHERPPEEGGGVLLDLGAHLVDQSLVAFGPVTHVYGEVAARRGGADDDVLVVLQHRSGVMAHLWASAVCPAPGPRWRVLGASGAYRAEFLDGQEAALRAERVPDDPTFGVEPPARWGELWHGDHADPVPSERGRWVAFYRSLAGALRRGGPLPVDAADAVAGLEILDAARASARLDAVVTL
jgi:predicted dehydrogenase